MVLLKTNITDYQNVFDIIQQEIGQIPSNPVSFKCWYEE